MIPVFFVMMLSFVSLAHAEPYLDLGLGATQFLPTVYDGTWYQAAFPHDFDTTAVAFRAGLGYRVNDRWSVQAQYLKMGISQVHSVAVADDDYDSQAHQCLQSCATPAAFHVTDRLEGVDFSVSRSFAVGGVVPFLRAGGAVMWHHLHARVGPQPFVLELTGRIPMGLVGGGLCYGNLCAETTYYHGLGGMNCLTPCGFPIATRAIVSVVSVKIPLRW